MPQRIIIYTSDISILFGWSMRKCQRELVIIRDSLGKLKHNKVTISEFCKYYGIEEDEVRKHIQ